MSCVDQLNQEANRYFQTVISLVIQCQNVSTIPIRAMGCRQCLPIGVVQLKGKHCQKPHCRNGVEDRFEQEVRRSPMLHNDERQHPH